MTLFYVTHRSRLQDGQIDEYQGGEYPAALVFATTKIITSTLEQKRLSPVAVFNIVNLFNIEIKKLIHIISREDVECCLIRSVTGPLPLSSLSTSRERNAG